MVSKKVMVPVAGWWRRGGSELAGAVGDDGGGGEGKGSGSGEAEAGDGLDGGGERGRR